jgi:hypothetical protein
MGGRNDGALKRLADARDNLEGLMASGSLGKSTRAREWRGTAPVLVSSMAPLTTSHDLTAASTSEATNVPAGGRRKVTDLEWRAVTKAKNGADVILLRTEMISMTGTTTVGPMNSRVNAIIPTMDPRTTSDVIGIAAKVHGAGMITAGRAGMTITAKQERSSADRIVIRRKCASDQAVSVLRVRAGQTIGRATTSGFRSIETSRRKQRANGSSKAFKRSGGNEDTAGAKQPRNDRTAALAASGGCRSVHGMIARIIIDGSMNTALILLKPRVNGNWKDCSKNGATGPDPDVPARK